MAAVPPPPGAPPPPGGPPPPSLAPPAAKAANAPSGGFLAELTKKRSKAAEHIPSRPKTPPPAGPEQFYDFGWSWTTPSDLFNTLQFGSNLLVVDLRDKQAFERLHVRAAVSVPWEEVKNEDMLEVEPKVDSKFRHRRIFNVVVYDQASTTSNISPTLQSFLDGLKAERRCKFPAQVLEGGLDALNQRFSFLIKGNPNFHDYEYPSEILENFMYLGSMVCASNRTALDDLGIKYIVNATDTCDMPFQDELEYLQCVLDDAPHEDIKQYFEPALQFLQKVKAANGRVLVHCKMGMSRSPTICILWLMKEHKYTLRQAKEYVQTKRPYINPNPGFLRQLGEYEEQLFGKTTIRFPDDGRPITVTTAYDWLKDNGQWETRRQITSPDSQ